MVARKLRGTAVVDAGATNTKILLFAPDGRVLAERRAATRHVEGPPYLHIDHEVVAQLAREALPELDRIMPIDVVVACAHGAALACLAEDGSLAFPIMDYMAEPPAQIVADYRKIEPPFEEVFGPLLPMALTHGLQLYWQSQAFPEKFARVTTIIPWIQYVAYRLSGIAVCEISGMSCQTQLMNVRSKTFSSLVKRQEWEGLFPRFAKAWEDLGPLLPEFRPSGFMGRGRVVAGVHDSNGNYLRYLASGQGEFTLLSTGTWSISFDTSTSVDQLDQSRDTNTNTDVFGRQVACSRFFGGKEYEIVSEGDAGDGGSLELVQQLIVQGTMALPSFTDSGGPLPGTGGKGRIIGALPRTPFEKASLASLYCALMCDQQLDAVSSKHTIIVDGPFAQNPVFLGLLAALRPRQKMLASSLRDGTTAGAALLAQIDAEERLPRVATDLKLITGARIAGFQDYAKRWLAAAKP
jgi:sugar (pentulose or hexulose) kinase